MPIAEDGTRVPYSYYDSTSGGKQGYMVAPYDRNLAQQYEAARRREVMDLARLKMQMASNQQQGMFDLARRLLGF